MIKRRIGSALLAGVMWLACVLPTLTACSKAAPNKYTVGEWLDKVEDSFNLVYFTQNEPYFSNINENSDYFTIAQVAAEWGIVDPAEGLKPDKTVTKEFCANTLVKAMNFDYAADVQIADENKLAHPDTVRIAVSEGLFELDAAGKFSPSSEPTKQEADKALLIARDHWVNLTYDESYDNSVVREGVINLGGVEEEKAPAAAAQGDFKVSYGGSVSLFDESGNYSANSIGGDITFEKGKLPADIAAGKILILPPDDTVPTSHAVKVESIVKNADGTVTIKTTAAQMMDVYENLDIQQNETVDFSNAVFYDANGKIIKTHESTAEDMAYFADAECWSPAAAIQPLYTEQLGKKNSLSGEVAIAEGLKLKFNCKNQKIDLTLEYKDGNSTMTITKQIPKIDINTKVDAHWEWDWFNSGIKVDVARAVVSYDDSASMKYKCSKDWDVSWDSDGNNAKESAEKLQEVYRRASNIYNAIKGYGKTTSGKASCQLLNILFPTGTGIDPQLIVRLNVGIEGEISISIDVSSKFGGELVKGKIRTIHEFNFEKNAELSGKAEGTFFLGLGISALGCTVIDVGVNAGVGAAVNLKSRLTSSATGAVIAEMAVPFGMGSVVKLSGAGEQTATMPVMFGTIDSEEHVCADVKVYPIVSLEVCTSKCLVGQIFGSPGKLTILDESSMNKSLVHIEYKDGGIQFMNQCSFEEETGLGIDVEVGKELKLNDEKVLVAVDSDSEYLNLSMIPKGYKLTDLQISVEDESIAKAELDNAESTKDGGIISVNPKIEGTTLKNPFGTFKISTKTELYYKSSPIVKKNLIKIHGVSDGVTMCTLSTKDGKHSVQAKIVVGNGGLGDAVSGGLIPEQYSYTITPGGSAEIKLSAFPTGYDASMLTYSSSDSSVAEVSVGGKITGRADGSAVVTIATTDGKYTAMVRVFVDKNAGAAPNANTSGGNGAFGGGNGGGTRG